MARVKEVETLSTEIVAVPDSSSESYVFDCVWRVHGLVKHYSHSHNRLNEYHARYEMAPRDANWKIIRSVETKRSRLDGQVPSNAAGGVLPPNSPELPSSLPNAAPSASEDFGDFGTDAEIDSSIPDSSLNLPGILDGNTLEDNTLAN